MGLQPGQPFAAKIWGCATANVEGHRAWGDGFLNESSNASLAGSYPEDAKMQEVWAVQAKFSQNLKATGTCLDQGRTWRRAWEFTYLPEPGTTEAGPSLAEKRSVGRFLREKGAAELLTSEARKDKDVRVSRMRR